MSRIAYMVLVGLLGLLAAGCGGAAGAEEVSEAPPSRMPAAVEPVDEALPGFLAAVRSRDCNRLARFMPHPSQRAPALREKPPDRAECAALERRAREFPPGFRMTGARAYGTAALVDGRAGMGPLTTLWALDDRGRWRFLVAYRGAQIGTEPEDERQMRANLARWMDAVRERDCPGIWRGFERGSRFVTSRGGERGRVCEDIEAAYSTPGPLQDIARNPAVRPARLGETRNFGFYGLSFPNGRFVTLIAATGVTPGKDSEHEEPGLWDYLVAREAEGGRRGP